MASCVDASAGPNPWPPGGFAGVGAVQKAGAPGRPGCAEALLEARKGGLVFTPRLLGFPGQMRLLP